VKIDRFSQGVNVDGHDGGTIGLRDSSGVGPEFFLDVFGTIRGFGEESRIEPRVVEIKA
jgi:hypothetical protein